MSYKKVILMPYFGSFPSWMDKYEPPIGYSWILDTDLDAFKKRVRDKLGIEYPGFYGNSKIWDYRTALGLLYEEELKGFDFWAHTDLDCCYGDMDKFIPDSLLDTLDVYSGHNTYIAGCWALYRNVPEVNNLFLTCHNWKSNMSMPEPNGWVEGEMSRILEGSGLRYKYDFAQGNPWVKGKPNLIKENGKLFQDGNEICFYHFRHFKNWPL